MERIHIIKNIDTMDNFILTITFSTGEVRELDLKPIMDEYPLFHALEENNLFENAKIDLGGFGIVWNEEFSISSGDAYSRSVETKEKAKEVQSSILIKRIIAERKNAGFTQKDISNLTGIDQPAIAKLEKGATDPRLSTILNVIDSLGLKLEIVPKDHKKR